MISSAAAAVRDPLIATLVILLSGWLLQFLFRLHPLGRAVVRVIFLITLSVILLYAGVVPYQPAQAAVTDGTHTLDMSMALYMDAAVNYRPLGKTTPAVRRGHLRKGGHHRVGARRALAGRGKGR